ncbi:unnamed protein product [Trichogramma brassicae]|uniref:Reverse transcriptase domain-containing protein n=1 Tax=Trichogramma brassicae TaxID=86971 RepID=A0A6H5IRQ1_9HYME|nr:unnamed protein product [Trichogramma brassicae]
MIVPPLNDDPPLLEEHLIPEVGVEELRWTYGRVRTGAAPGPDGIPNTALKAVVKTFFDNFRCVFTVYLRKGCFSTRCKRQRLVPILKPGKPAMEPSSYRLLCMLDTAGEILERIIAGRLEAHTEGPAKLADSQYGFRKERSTIDAIQTVLSTARLAISGKRWHQGTKEYCAINTLDVRNAFNSARWNKILIALSQMEVPAYLLRIVYSYFCDRVLEFTMDDGAETYDITAGMPQGSVLGPILWNVIYNRILRLKLPRPAKFIRERTYDQKGESKICCESERSSSVRVKRDILGDAYVGLTSTARLVRSYVVARVKSASAGTSRFECARENQWIQRTSRPQGQPRVDLDQEKISTSCGESGGPALGRCMCESYAPTRPPGLRSSRLPVDRYIRVLSEAV